MIKVQPIGSRYIIILFPPKATISRLSLSLSLTLCRAMDSKEADEVKPLAEFLIRHHSEQLRSIVLSSEPKLHYPLYIEYRLTTHQLLFRFLLLLP